MFEQSTKYCFNRFNFDFNECLSLSLSLLRDEIQSDIIQFLIQFFFYREENSFIFDSQQQNFEFEITKSFSKLIFL